MKIVAEIQQLANYHSLLRNEAATLWSWLPSRQVTEKYHGDYCGDFTPSATDIMREASIVFAKQNGHEIDDEEWHDYCERCWCGEYCEKQQDFDKGSMVIAMGPGVHEWLKTWEGRQGKVVFTKGVDNLPDVGGPTVWQRYGSYAKKVSAEALEKEDIRIICFPDAKDENDIPTRVLLENAWYAVFCSEDGERVFMKNR